MQIPVIAQTTVLLVLSNVFMTLISYTKRYTCPAPQAKHLCGEITYQVAIPLNGRCLLNFRQVAVGHSPLTFLDYARKPCNANTPAPRCLKYFHDDRLVLASQGRNAQAALLCDSHKLGNRIC